MVDSDRHGSADKAAGAGQSAYDVVVVGAGIAGLTAGALLAHAGKKVLVVEAEQACGGYARALIRGPYAFDRADHLIMGCAPESPFGPGVIDTVLRHLGVRGRCEFSRMDDPFYVAQFPDFRLEVPHGRDAYIEAHAKHFPGDQDGIRRLAEVSAEACREFLAFPINPRFGDLLRSPRRFPTLFRYRDATISQAIDGELSDPRLKAIYATLWPWVGPPPGQASFLTWAIMMASYVEDGAYYCLGSFQRLADALAVGLVEAGGELLVGTRVTGIVAERGRVAGVTLQCGQRITAPTVISNIDARETFERLLGSDQVRYRYLRRLRRLTAAHSMLVLYAATDLDARALGAQHDTTLYTEWDHDRAYAKGLTGEITMLSVLIPTLKDPALAPPGEHLVILKATAPSEPSGDGALADRILELAELVLPGLRQHLTFVDEGGVGTDPRLHVLGPYGGWTTSPKQAGRLRLPQQTPLAGLLLAGQWTRPGLGVWTVTQSGIEAARLVLGAPTSASVLPLRR